MVKANNDAGQAKCYATLIVKPATDRLAMKMRLIESCHSVQTHIVEGGVAPEITRSFRDLHVRPGEPCTMEVVITGKPAPKVCTTRSLGQYVDRSSSSSSSSSSNSSSDISISCSQSSKWKKISVGMIAFLFFFLPFLSFCFLSSLLFTLSSFSLLLFAFRLFSSFSPFFIP